MSPNAADSAATCAFDARSARGHPPLILLRPERNRARGIRARQEEGHRDVGDGLVCVANVDVERVGEPVEHEIAFGRRTRRHHARKDACTLEPARRRLTQHRAGRHEELVVEVGRVAEVGLAVHEGPAAELRREVHRAHLQRARMGAGRGRRRRRVDQEHLLDGGRTGQRAPAGDGDECGERDGGNGRRRANAAKRSGGHHLPSNGRGGGAPKITFAG